MRSAEAKAGYLSQSCSAKALKTARHDHIASFSLKLGILKQGIGFTAFMT